MAKTMEKNGEKSKLVPAPHREGENPKGITPRHRSPQIEIAATT